MKKKLMSILLIASMSMSIIVGCGKKEAEAVDVIPTETETETETSAVDPTVLGYVTTTESETEETVEENKEPEFLSDGTFDKNDALYRIDRLLMAYKDLILSNKETEYNLLDRAEKLDHMGTIIPKTKDGIELNVTTEEADERKVGPGAAAWCVVRNYFYNYVNNNGEYYDFADYIESHTYDEILHEVNSDSDLERFYLGNTNEFVMAETLGVTLYLYEAKSIEIGEIYDKENLTMGITSMNDTEVAYEATILVDGEFTGLTALYDENGKMLNITSNDDFNSWTFTFEEGEVQTEVAESVQ